MANKLKENEGITLVVVLMVMAILLAVIGAGLLFSGTNAKMTGNYQSGTRAFYAADAALGQGLNQLSANTATTIAAFGPVDMGNGLKYRSGSRTAGSAQLLQFVSTQQATGYSLNSGTGYNATGYAFYQYQINVTGTYEVAGSEVAGREVEAQAMFGPISQ
jgi:hypothetical protein